MKYFKKSEVVQLYNVSDKTVRNWIAAAQQGKIDLELVNINTNFYIRDTLGNSLILKELSQRSKKYRNKLSHKTLRPHPTFYEMYSNEQIADIANNLEIMREIPHQYRYFGVGATYWQSYLYKLYTAGSANTLSATHHLLSLNKPFLDSFLSNYDSTNIIDLGVGNGLAIRDLLAHLSSTRKLEKYIGIDISSALLNTTEKNLASWLDPTPLVEKYVRDFTFQRFGEIASATDSPLTERRTANIITFLGGTLSNFRDPRQPLATIRDSMRKDDMLAISLKLDSEAARIFFDFNVDRDLSELPRYDSLILNLLGIEPSLYKVEKLYDSELKARVFYVRLKQSVTVRFENNHIHKDIDLEKGERILLWRAWHNTLDEIAGLLSECGFDVIQTSQTLDQNFGLLFAQISQKRH